MTSLSFEEIFGFYSTPQNKCSDSKINISYPELPEATDLYRKLIYICADPQALLDLLNNQIANHIRSGTPDYFLNFDIKFCYKYLI